TRKPAKAPPRIPGKPKSHFGKDRARKYDRRIRQVMPGYASMHEFARLAVAEIAGAKGRVLVVGAGTGRECIEIAGAYPGLRVTGVEPAPPMLEKAKANVARAGLGRRVTFHAGFVDTLEAKDFDAATLILVMHFIPDDGTKLNLLRAIGKRLKRGRPLILIDMFGDKKGASFARLMDVWQRFQAERGIDRKDAAKGRRHIRKDI